MPAYTNCPHCRDVVCITGNEKLRVHPVRGKPCPGSRTSAAGLPKVTAIRDSVRRRRMSGDVTKFETELLALCGEEPDILQKSMCRTIAILMMRKADLEQRAGTDDFDFKEYRAICKELQSYIAGMDFKGTKKTSSKPKPRRVEEFMEKVAADAEQQHGRSNGG